MDRPVHGPLPYLSGGSLIYYFRDGAGQAPSSLNLPETKMRMVLTSIGIMTLSAAIAAREAGEVVIISFI